MTMHDIFEVARGSISLQLIESLFPGGEWKGSEYWVRSPLRDDHAAGSFSISEKGPYNDFASGDSGDIIDLVARTREIEPLEAARLICETAGAFVPNHEQAKETRQKYEYTDAAGRVLFTIHRIDKPGQEKKIYKTGDMPKESRPLYRLPALLENPTAPIIVVEGEKKAQVPIPGHIITTWANGANSWRKTDFSPLFGRSVTLWPDNDEPGLHAMRAIARELSAHGSQVRMVQIPNGKPAAWDLADAAEDGTNIRAMLESAEAVSSEPEPAAAQEPSQPGQLKVMDTGVYNKISRVKDILSTNFDFRHNIITGRYMFRRKDETKFHDMSDDVFNTLRLTLDEQVNLKISAEDMKAIIQSNFSPVYDPVQEYFDSLPPWDHTDHIQILADMVTTVPGQYGPDINPDGVFYDYLSRWLVANVAMWLQRPASIGQHAVNQQCLTLCGIQGIGKTTFLSKLGIDPAYTLIGALDPGNKDSLVYYAEKLLIVLDELETTSKHDLGALKSNMTLPHVTVRRPYGHFPENLPRRAGFSACCNDIDILQDPTGSRRWLCVEVEKVNYEAVTPELMRQVYSQALHMLNSGFIYWFANKDILMIESANEHFAVVSQEEECLFSIIYHPNDKRPADVPVTNQTNAELRKLMTFKFPGFSFSDKRLGQVLNKYKFKRKTRASDQQKGYDVYMRKV